MKKSITSRALVFFGSFIVILVVLELLLRFGGYLYLNGLMQADNRQANSKSVHTILTVGDSYTVGGEGEWADNYPSQLQGMLNQYQPGKYAVINGGICEANSTQTLRYMEKLINAYDVDSIVLLVGAANRFNLVGFPHNRTRGFLENFRLYKLGKIFMINLKSRMVQIKADQNIQLAMNESINAEGETQMDEEVDCKDIEKIIKNSRANKAEIMRQYFRLGECFQESGELKKAERLYKVLIGTHNNVEFAYTGLRKIYNEQGRHKEVDRLMQAAMDEHPSQVWPYLEMAQSYRYQKKYETAAGIYQQGLGLNDQQGLVYKDLGEMYFKQGKVNEAQKMFELALNYHGDEHIFDRLMGIYFKQGRYEEVIKYSLKNIRITPTNFDHYYPLVKAYEFQNQYNAKDINHFLKSIARQHEELSDDPTFQKYLELFANEEQIQERIYAWFDADLDRIVQLCRENNIQLIVQSYPYPYTAVNEYLQKFAEEHALSFIDHYRIFQALPNTTDYFVDSDHCTVEGHRLMAQNIFEYFKQN